MPDFGAKALEAFRAATGFADVPRKAGDPHWFEFLEFNRQAFRTYLAHYVAEVKRTHPNFQLCSNWAFTDHMPEPVCVPVDYLSGDYSPEDSVNSARFSARYLARQGKPWDLMAWGFTTKAAPDGSREKTVPQLQREAAAVLALGGGFQAYFNQRRDGSIREERMPVMAEVAKFCRARQAVCHHALPVPQVALVYSTANHYREINGLFSRDLSNLSGTLQALLESQLSVEVLGEHHLAGRLAEYPLIVVPETAYLEPAFVRNLLAYAENGGNLLLVGPQTADLFAAPLGIVWAGPADTAVRQLLHGATVLSTQGLVRNARLDPKATPFGQLRPSSATDAPVHPAASIARVGRGRIATTCFSFSRAYLDTRSPAARAFLNDLVRQLFPEPIVEVRGSPDVDLALNRLGGRLAINLVNTAGPHADLKTPILASIPPVGPLEITLRHPRKPTHVFVEPEHQPLAFTFDAAAARVQMKLPRLDIHAVVTVE
jgi:hypothetical protein